MAFLKIALPALAIAGSAMGAFLVPRPSSLAQPNTQTY